MLEFCEVLTQYQELIASEDEDSRKLVPIINGFLWYGGLDAMRVALGGLPPAKFLLPFDIMLSVKNLGEWLMTLVSTNVPSLLLDSKEHTGLFAVDCLNATQGVLYRKLSALFSGTAPHWSQVFWCGPNSSRIEVQMFFERVRANPRFLYVLLEPNKLAQKVRLLVEVLVQALFVKCP